MNSKMLDQVYVGAAPDVFADVRTNSLENEKHYDTNINQMVPDSSAENQTIICAGCGTKIVDRYFLLVAEQHWHVECLRCADCNFQLDSQLTCFIRDGLIFCKLDYHRRYSQQRCARCHVGLSAHELVMRARDCIYHIDCFLCFSCNKPLRTGDTYGIHCDQVFCQEDYEHLLNNFNTDTSYCNEYSTSFPGNIGDMLTLCGEPMSKGRSRKRKHLLAPDGCLQLGIFTNDHGEILSRDAFNASHPPRQKRVRTSFKHHQLRTMKSYFAMNHNPDAKDLKELSRKTQLSKRVLQVWFQNARAKYRRSAAKQGNEILEDGSSSKPIADDSETSCRSPSALSDVSSNHSAASSLDTNNQSVVSSLGVTEEHDEDIEHINEIFSDENSAPA
ncbi:LIM/homeobox protein Lhx9-like [Ruditapes philippinarum]|uniref:LIM/homeobox protein Lhx9-like n=1 Tax=Ruditapes philippinarum TaxID=129788 RepID=UPI00295B3C30|nr:LIM/homeobox protein Lhx9-like [Ruditapes philippinarum]